MTLEEKINESLKNAMKAKAESKVRTLRAIKSAILLAKTQEGATESMTEAEEIKLLSKMVKQRKDSLEIYQKQSREDLAKIELEELSVIETFLPEQLSEEDIKKSLNQIIEQTGARSMKDMGKVMGMASQQLAGKADGKTISKIVKELLG